MRHLGTEDLLKYIIVGFNHSQEFFTKKFQRINISSSYSFVTGPSSLHRLQKLQVGLNSQAVERSA